MDKLNTYIILPANNIFFFITVRSEGSEEAAPGAVEGSGEAAGKGLLSRDPELNTLSNS